jgi:hypothetical protein
MSCPWIIWVFWATNVSRTRWIAGVLCCSSVLTTTKRMLGRCTASQIASASARSFFRHDPVPRMLFES